MDSQFIGSALTIILVIAFAMLIFIAIRSLILWYFRIDTIVENQEKQIHLLQKILDSQVLKPGSQIDLTE